MSDDSYASSSRERLLEDVARLTAEREAALVRADSIADAYKAAKRDLRRSRHEYGEVLVAFDARTAERDAARSLPVITACGQCIDCTEADDLSHDVEDAGRFVCTHDPDAHLVIARAVYDDEPPPEWCPLRKAPR